MCLASECEPWKRLAWRELPGHFFVALTDWRTELCLDVPSEWGEQPDLEIRKSRWISTQSEKVEGHHTCHHSRGKESNISYKASKSHKLYWVFSLQLSHFIFTPILRDILGVLGSVIHSIPLPWLGSEPGEKKDNHVNRKIKSSPLLLIIAWLNMRVWVFANYILFLEEQITNWVPWNNRNVVSSSSGRQTSASGC